MIQLKFNQLDKETYLQLRDAVGWKRLTDIQADKALKNSLVTISAWQEGKPVGMGRLVGDGAVICYVQDLVIHPSAQGIGVGSMILKSLIEYAKDMQFEGTEMMLDLMCAKGREEFYQSFGFIARPTDTLGPGMIQYLTK